MGHEDNGHGTAIEDICDGVKSGLYALGGGLIEESGYKIRGVGAWVEVTLQALSIGTCASCYNNTMREGGEVH